MLNAARVRAARRARTTHIATGVVATLALVAIAYGTTLLFQQKHVDTVPLTLESDRAGLLMEANAPVKVRGVKVGRVRAVEETGAGARLDLLIFPEHLDSIPADVRAQIVPPTAFGAKYVQLDPPANSKHSARAITAGSVIAADHVTVEVNHTFEHLMGVLDAAPPSKVNAALTSMSTALDGRGDQMGELITGADAYLAALNPSLPQLQTDLRLGAQVTDTYADITPDLLKIARNGSTTSDTLVDQQTEFTTLLTSFGTAADSVGGFLKDNRKGLHSTVTRAEPTLRLLAEYSPIFPCTLEGMVVDHKLGMGVFGGPNPGMNMVVHLVPSAEPYKAPTDLPKLGADNAPSCHMLPNIPVERIHDPWPVWDTGSNPSQAPEKKSVDAVAQILFGAAGGAVTP
jgi:phospholipid/cholesterol/gamma-HCH transport system substrate-binding protein